MGNRTPTAAEAGDKPPMAMDREKAAVKIRFIGFLFVLLALVLTGAPAVAQEEVTWQVYDVTVDILEDGSIHVTESIEVAFDGEFSEGYATIPMDRIEAIENVDVSVAEPGGEPVQSTLTDRGDYTGEPGTHTVYDEDGRKVIDYGMPPVDGEETRSIVIEYDAFGVIRDYPDNDPPRQEIRWTAISDEVTEVGSIDEASATINFPESIARSEATRFDPEETTADTTSVTWLRMGMEEGDSLQVLASFPSMTDATAPAWQADADKYESRQENVPGLAMITGAASLVGFGVLMAFMWMNGVRDPEIGLVADILPEPPDDLPAAHVGTLTDESFDDKDAIGMLLELERRGFVTLGEDDSALNKKAEDPERYEINLALPISEAPAWARPLLEGLFGKNVDVGKSVSFKQLQKVAQNKGKIGKAVEKDLFERGYFEELPAETRKRWILRSILGLVLVGLVIGAIAWWSRDFSGWLIAASGLTLVLFVVALIVSAATPRKSIEGAETAAKWKAFERYLKQMEKEMPAAEQRKLFDTYLPWAIVLGFDKSSWQKWMEDDQGYRWGSHQYRPWDPRYGRHVAYGRHRDRRDPASARSGSGPSFDVQSMSDRGLSGLQGANLSMFAMLNSATGAFKSGSSSSGSGSGSASVGSSGGGGRGFS